MSLITGVVTVQFNKEVLDLGRNTCLEPLLANVYGELECILSCGVSELPSGGRLVIEVVLNVETYSVNISIVD